LLEDGKTVYRCYNFTAFFAEPSYALGSQPWERNFMLESEITNFPLHYISVVMAEVLDLFPSRHLVINCPLLSV
jgi:hypothetical protein